MLRSESTLLTSAQFVFRSESTLLTSAQFMLRSESTLLTSAQFMLRSESTLLTSAPRLPKDGCFLEGSQASPICPWKSNMWMKMSVECWWKRERVWRCSEMHYLHPRCGKGKGEVDKI